jgi:uncharacterized membrane protein
MKKNYNSLHLILGSCLLLLAVLGLVMAINVRTTIWNSGYVILALTFLPIGFLAFMQFRGYRLQILIVNASGSLFLFLISLFNANWLASLGFNTEISILLQMSNITSLVLLVLVTFLGMSHIRKPKFTKKFILYFNGITLTASVILQSTFFLITSQPVALELMTAGCFILGYIVYVTLLCSLVIRFKLLDKNAPDDFEDTTPAVAKEQKAEELRFVHLEDLYKKGLITEEEYQSRLHS